jgi:hypothetical protein
MVYALTINWGDLVPPNELSFLIGNPPYRGKKEQSEEQKADLISTFGNLGENVGNLDYISAWFFKAAIMMQNTRIKAAFVSTNSIVQGEKVPILWPK